MHVDRLDRSSVRHPRVGAVRVTGVDEEGGGDVRAAGADVQVDVHESHGRDDGRCWAASCSQHKFGQVWAGLGGCGQHHAKKGFWA
eukprot:7380715-Prymnesium_polylepis.1